MTDWVTALGSLGTGVVAVVFVCGLCAAWGFGLFSLHTMFWATLLDACGNGVERHTHTHREKEGVR